MKIVLGSTSPRRKEILGSIFTSLEIVAPDADETVHPGETPGHYAERISEAKARSVLNRVDPYIPALIITCDTIVTIGGRIIGKPGNHDHAKAIIGGLSGRTHQVISAISLTSTGNPSRIDTGSESSSITFRFLTAEQIDNYLGKIHYMDKAGAYAVQEWGHLIIDRIEGSVTNVIGFPLRLFFRMFHDFDRNGLNSLFSSSEKN